MVGLLGKKIGMTRVFDNTGRQVPVTVIEVGPCTVLQRKTTASDGYEAYQVGFGPCREKLVSKALIDHCKLGKVGPMRFQHEFPVDAGDTYQVGDAVTVSIFEGIGFVDVVGVTKGRGFQGVVRLYRMKGGPMTHGGHSKRRVGSIGCREFPGRVHKNKRMPRHMGNTQITQQNLQVIQVRSAENLLLVQGAVPGPVGALVVVRRALKKVGKRT